jgi:hypothetical protein
MVPASKAMSNARMQYRAAGVRMDPIGGIQIDITGAQGWGCLLRFIVTIHPRNETAFASLIGKME